MLELVMAVAFAVAPLTIYLPPLRSFNLLVRSMEAFFKRAGGLRIRSPPRFSVSVLRGVS